MAECNHIFEEVKDGHWCFRCDIFVKVCKLWKIYQCPNCKRIRDKSKEVQA